ncbi:hypothetical protein [Streptomyces sp. NBC_01314]|uniref:hypothetical protein n=1 Tax=Streptomyces sp. NBC_01314 TaxID=2903821 RepID=UPI00308C6218|nr:hypothetical protein OG622_10895 [Streptomyces sp. NBC_01314]
MSSFDPTNSLTAAELAHADQADAAVRDLMRLPVGGMSLGHDGWTDEQPYADGQGVGTYRFKRLGTGNTDRECTACMSGVRADGGPCERPCGRPAVMAVSFDRLTPEYACGGHLPEMLRDAASQATAADPEAIL